MRLATFVFLIVVATAGCKGSTANKAAPEPPSAEPAAAEPPSAEPAAAEPPNAAQVVGDEILKVMASFTDDVCRCTDQACVDVVEKAMMEWAMKNMDRMKGLTPTKAQDEEGDKIQDRMDACKERIESP